jgi:hypothetical protein
MNTIRVVLPYQLYTLARCDSEITLELTGPATLGVALTALEAAYPCSSARCATAPAGSVGH